MAEYGGEQYKKQEGDRQTDQNIGGKEGKQGVVEKIKEKLPGGDHGADEKKADEHTPYATNTVGDGYGNAGEEGHEKKGLMDKIKDMLPGGGDHGSEEHKTQATASTVGGGEHGDVGEEEHEKLMDQIKDTVAKTV
ncbi:dehydrin [Artemisia annua]|uniref:Dehydrin n=1 Tax=Artemisia annua TaxID=35608 RepID=A0A2U1MPV0_ARTAN|nr:dehydrin [Artemisia annua]